MEQKTVKKQTTVKILRQVHLHFTLFLLPWMLLYAASTAVMNHREFFHNVFGKPAEAQRVVERDIVYEGRFDPDTHRNEVAGALLAHLGLEGASHVRGNLEDKQIKIYRQSLTDPKEITYIPASGRLVVESRQVNMPGFLEEFHRRRGYGKGFVADEAWAVVVDLVILAMVFWAVSGVWIWWGQRSTRRPGWLALVGGTVLFVLLLCTI